MLVKRSVAQFFAGLLVVGAVTVGGMPSAQARDSGWNGTVAPSHVPSGRPNLRDSGWNGT
jgi:hypothetical protein